MNQESRSDIPEEFRKLDELERKATAGEWITFPYYHLSICTSEFPKQGILNMVEAPHQPDEMQAVNADFVCEARNTVRPLLNRLSESITRQETASKNAEFYANETVKLEAQISEYKLEVDRLSTTLKALKNTVNQLAERGLVMDGIAAGLNEVVDQALKPNKEII